MKLSPLRLGAWWGSAAVLAVGVGVVAVTGRLLVGGVVMSVGFVLAAVLRAWLPEHRAGGLHIRTKGVDVLFFSAAAIDVLGAILLVTHHLRPSALIAVNAVFGALLAWLWWRGIARYHGPRRPRVRPTP